MGEKMGVTIALGNRKGGVGKSTTTANLAAGLGKSGKKVLAIDLDGQMDLNFFLTGSKDFKLGIMDLMLDDTNDVSIKDCIVAAKKEYPNVFVIPATNNLDNLDVELNNKMERELRLKEVIELFKDKFDYILIDCPPKLGMACINALVASDYYIMMRDMSPTSKDGTKSLGLLADRIKKRLNPDLKFAGEVMIGVQKENATALKMLVLEFLEENKGNPIRIKIPHSSKVVESMNDLKPISDIVPKTSKIYKSFEKLTNSVLTL